MQLRAPVMDWLRAIAVKNGNISIIFALFIAMLGGVVGLAIDMARSSSAHTQLQSALDSAVLAAARRQSIGEEDAISAVTEFVRANFEQQYPDLQVRVTSSVNANGQVQAVATVDMPTTFLRILGRTNMRISSKSTAQFGAGAAEIALVLDNTFSMSGSKIDALKDGAKRLIDIVYEPEGSDQTVRVGLVPFAQYVNVGLGYRNEPWLSVAADSSTTTNQCWDTYPNVVYSNCHDVTATGYNDGIPYSYTYPQCDVNYGAPVQVCGPVANNQTWFGCVGSRAYPLDTAISGDFSTPVPGIMNAQCTQPLARLTNDTDAIKAQIDAMTPVGETFVQSGVLWGWRLLSPQAPFGDGADRSVKPDVKRFMVLMTDGANTKSPNYPRHDGGDAVLANNLTKETCDSVKSEGTFIYAIAFDVTDPTIQALLRDCATAPPYYYVAEDNAGLRQAFESIANAVVAIRLTQ